MSYTQSEFKKKPVPRPTIIIPDLSNSIPFYEQETKTLTYIRPTTINKKQKIR